MAALKDSDTDTDADTDTDGGLRGGKQPVARVMVTTTRTSVTSGRCPYGQMAEIARLPASFSG